MSRKPLSELAPLIGNEEATFAERVTFFHDLFSIELESGHDVDFEAIGLSNEEVEEWKKRYPTEVELAEKKCKGPDGILSRPHCGY